MLAACGTPRTTPFCTQLACRNGIPSERKAGAEGAEVPGTTSFFPPAHFLAVRKWTEVPAPHLLPEGLRVGYSNVRLFSALHASGLTRVVWDAEYTIFTHPSLYSSFFFLTLCVCVCVASFIVYIPHRPTQARSRQAVQPLKNASEMNRGGRATVRSCRAPLPWRYSVLHSARSASV